MVRVAGGGGVWCGVGAGGAAKRKGERQGSAKRGSRGRWLSTVVFLAGRVVLGWWSNSGGNGGGRWLLWWLMVVAARWCRERKKEGIRIPYDFPIHLVPEILSWLPVKTLLQYKCVCKSWHAIIKNVYFISKHLENYYNNNDDFRDCYIAQFNVGSQFGELGNYEMLVHSSLQRVLAYEQIETPERNTFIVGPCHGIFYQWCWYQGDKGRYLWNPALKELKQLPPLIKKPDVPSHITFCNEQYGFGYDPFTKDYKVIVIVHYKNISVYWIGSHEPGIFNSDVVVSFDLGTEICKEMQLPNYDKWEYEKLALATLHDSVSLILVQHSKCLTMWTLNEGLWIKKFTTNLDFEQLGFFGHWNNKLLFSRYLGNILYDPETQEWWRISHPETQCWAVSAYKQSLVSVK
ncbi:F-box/kelch-repeat protein At3g06240-like [Spinacia oleracea]|uniref:F-box/kelch-repeat protein At3g06240-like n=1 Tax=Spinacia oleracea TaxID=3562 RepID=A0ABM3R4E4_SPIOL|nr:F-box/kelch-repeat protein At3g06240-like [Spinacia oleracea]